MNNDDIVNFLDQEIIEGESLIVEIGDQRDKFEQLLAETNGSLERVAGAVRTLQQMRQQLERPHTSSGERETVHLDENDPMRLWQIRDLAGLTP